MKTREKNTNSMQDDDITRSCVRYTDEYVMKILKGLERKSDRNTIGLSVSSSYWRGGGGKQLQLTMQSNCEKKTHKQGSKNTKSTPTHDPQHNTRTCTSRPSQCRLGNSRNITWLNSHLINFPSPSTLLTMKNSLHNRIYTNK